MPGTEFNITLAEKLRIKPGKSLMVLNPPAAMFEMLAPLHDVTILARSAGQKADIILYFIRSHKIFMDDLPCLKDILNDGGSLWIAWRNGKSAPEAQKDQKLLRDLTRKTGLVDKKICSLNETFSALEFVKA